MSGFMDQSMDFTNARRNTQAKGDVDFQLEAQLEWRNHVLVIISNRLGLTNVAPEYFKVIKKYMKLPTFIGLVGGKPRFAYYFVGHLDSPAEEANEG